MARDKPELAKFKQAIAAKFEMQDLGEVRRFLGLEVQRDRDARKLTITATDYIHKMLRDYNMADAYGVKTPATPNTMLRVAQDGDDLLPSATPYQALVGSLNYLVTWVRPDIAFAVSQLAKHQQKPTKEHWEAGKQCLRYLKRTINVGLTYSSSPNPASADLVMAVGSSVVSGSRLYGHVDASYAECTDTRRSHTGFVFFFANAAISWASRRQDLTATSSTEAEYVALSDAVKEAVYLRNLYQELLGVANLQVPILEDNQSTIKQALNFDGQPSRLSKHIDVRLHFLKDHFRQGDVSLHYVPTALQVADCLTKNAVRVRFESMTQIILGSN